MFPGSSTMNQLDRIIEITGTPSPEVLKSLGFMFCPLNFSFFFQDIEAIQSPFAATMLDSLTPTEPRNLADVFPNASAEVHFYCVLIVSNLTLYEGVGSVETCSAV